MSGQSKLAIEAADKLAANVLPAVRDDKGLEPFYSFPLAVRVRFGRWDDILAQPEPDESFAVTRATWHFARGMAYAAKNDVARAEAEQRAFRKASEKAGGAQMGLNNWAVIAPVPGGILAGRIAMARGEPAAAADALRKAVAAQDALAYDEPPGWPWPAREALGRALLAGGMADAAEKVFRDDLARNPHNARSLLGLAEALKAQGKAAEAETVAKDQSAAWADADGKITLDDL